MHTLMKQKQLFGVVYLHNDCAHYAPASSEI
jgi:hypothetical protein